MCVLHFIIFVSRFLVQFFLFLMFRQRTKNSSISIEFRFCETAKQRPDYGCAVLQKRRGNKMNDSGLESV